jgi:hypothetical protein
MLAWQVPYLGWRYFPAELSEFEISRFFTFEPEVHRAIRSRYKDTLRLGVALQLGFLTMCGRTLHAFQRVPAELLKHLGEQMEIPAPDIATLRALYKGVHLILLPKLTVGFGLFCRRRARNSWI